MRVSKLTWNQPNTHPLWIARYRIGDINEKLDNGQFKWVMQRLNTSPIPNYFVGSRDWGTMLAVRDTLSDMFSTLYSVDYMTVKCNNTMFCILPVMLVRSPLVSLAYDTETIEEYNPNSTIRHLFDLLMQLNTPKPTKPIITPSFFHKGVKSLL